MPDEEVVEKPKLDLEDIDPVPPDDPPTTPAPRRSTRRSITEAETTESILDTSDSSSGRKRRYDLAAVTSLIEAGQESDSGHNTKRTRQVDESPQLSARVLAKDPPFSSSADSTEANVAEKENGKRFVTLDDSDKQESVAQNGGDVEVEEVAAQKEISALPVESSVHLRNGDKKSTHSSEKEEGDGKVAPALHRPPEVDRLRLPSHQHALGKKAKDSAKIGKEDNIAIASLPPRALDHYETPLQRLPRHTEQQFAESEAHVKKEPYFEQSHIPSGESTKQTMLPQDEEPPLEESPSPRRFRTLNPFRNISSPQRVERPVGYEEEEDLLVPPATRKTFFRTTAFWFFALLVLQACCMSHWINHVLHSVVAGSKSLTVVYRGLLTPPDGSAENAIAATPLVALLPEGVTLSLLEEKQRIREQNMLLAEQNALIDEENAKIANMNWGLHEQIIRVVGMNQETMQRNEQLRKDEAILSESLLPLEEKKAYLTESNDELQMTLRSLLEDFENRKEYLDTLMPEVANKLDGAAKKVASTEKLLGERLEKTEELFETFQIIAEKQSSAGIIKTKRIMGESQDMLFTLFRAQLWQPSTVPDCSQNTTVVRPKKKKRARHLGLPVETVNQLVDEFLSEIIRDFEYSEYDEELIESIQNLINVAADKFPMEELVANAPDPAPLVVHEGPSLDDIRMLISERLQIYQADQTGRLDYASLHNGAHVVYHATSPSLVDNLPMFNRLAAMLSISLYGYGPEAALTPTWPEGALGQCWAFERDVRGNRMGLFADLTVALPEPIHVESVSIEHPPPEVTDNAKTAIKAFKVVGYEGAGATGHPWPLGSFNYDWMDRRKHSRQEFPIPRKIVGQDVPVLQTITLAIDSNWGEPVSCLYRFRVHGSPVS